MLRLVTLSMLFMAWLIPAQAANFEDTVAAWKSPENVAAWLKSNFKFDTKRQKIIQKRLKQSGPSGLLVRAPDRKSTRLNSSHRCISYAVFCLKKKRKKRKSNGKRNINDAHKHNTQTAQSPHKQRK